MSKLRLLMLASVLVLVAVASSSSAAQCVCGHLSYPVECSDGNFYGNPCLAACAGATDCVPIEQ